MFNADKLFRKKEAIDNGERIAAEESMRPVFQVADYIWENAPDSGPFYFELGDGNRITFADKSEFDSVEHMQEFINKKYAEYREEQEFRGRSVLEQSIIVERQPQFDTLVNQINEIDIHNDEAVLAWLLPLLQSGTAFRIDTDRIKTRFAERGVEADIESHFKGWSNQMDVEAVIEKAFLALVSGDKGLNREYAINHIIEELEKRKGG